MDWPLNLEELEERAGEVLDPVAFDYYRSGAGDEITLARNRSGFATLRLWPRILRDVSEVRTAVEILGSAAATPIVVAPTAFHGLAHERGEIATAEGAAAAGAILCLSTLSNTTPEEVAEAAPGAPRWFQLYVFRDRGLTRELITRAEAVGYESIVVTVDAPVLGRRERDVRNRFELPGHLRIACVDDVVAAPDAGMEADSGLAAYFASQLDPSLTWADLEWLVDASALPIVVKGVHRADDAERAVAAGAAAIAVSNHGARQLDTVPAAIEMLAPVAEAVAGRAEVLVDGGVRRGTDVVKALCLGASAVMVGRPVLWGLALGGAEGVSRVLGMLQAELVEAMTLCGAAGPEELGPDLLAR